MFKVDNYEATLFLNTRDKYAALSNLLDFFNNASPDSKNDTDMRIECAISAALSIKYAMEHDRTGMATDLYEHLFDELYNSVKEYIEDALKYYTVEITEILQRRIIVKADSRADAIENAKALYHCGHIELTQDNHMDTTFEIITEDK